MFRLNQKGMTLLETVVALGIFSVVVVSGVSLLISGIKSQAYAAEMNLVNNEASFLLERMAREIRMANSTNITIPANYSSVTFINHEGLVTVYCSSNTAGTMCQNSGPNISVRYGGGALTPINSSGVKLADLNFIPNGDTNGPPISNPPGQPMITIFMELQSSKNPNISIKLQTTVTPRVY